MAKSKCEICFNRNSCRWANSAVDISNCCHNYLYHPPESEATRLTGETILPLSSLGTFQYPPEAKPETLEETLKELVLEIRQYLCDTEFAPEPFTKAVDLNVLTKEFPVRIIQAIQEADYVKPDKDQIPPENPYNFNELSHGFGVAINKMLTPHDNSDGTESLFMRIVRKKE